MLCFAGNENNAVPVETVHTCRQSCCDDISSDKRYESSSEDSLKVGKQNDMTNKNDREQGHKNSSDTKYNAFLSGSLSFRHNSEIMGNSGIEDEKSFLKDTLEMEIEDFKKSKSVPILPRFNNSISSLFRVVKNISDPDAADQNTPWSETYDSTFTSAQKELIAGDINDKFDGEY